MKDLLKEAEIAIGIPAARWEGRCFEIASELVAAGVVKGVAVYGHWNGPIAKGELALIPIDNRLRIEREVGKQL